MQLRSASLLLILPLLYLGAGALANHPAQAQQQDAKTPEQPGPHIAVLLPLKSSTIGRQADAVRLGVLEAAKVHRGTTLPLVIYATGDDAFDVVQAYETAVRNGAQLVIGPLTRSAVTALAGTRLVDRTDARAQCSRGRYFAATGSVHLRAAGRKRGQAGRAVRARTGPPQRHRGRERIAASRAGWRRPSPTSSCDAAAPSRTSSSTPATRPV